MKIEILHSEGDVLEGIAHRVENEKDRKRLQKYIDRILKDKVPDPAKDDPIAIPRGVIQQ